MKQIKKIFGKKTSTEVVSSQSPNGNKGNFLRDSYTEKFIRPTEFPARSGRMTYIRKDYHHIISNMIPFISDGTVSISSYIDHVLTEHFKQYGIVIDEMYMEKQRASTSVSAFVSK